MAILDRLTKPKGESAPADVTAKLKRGRERLEQVAPRRREAIEFANNNHYVSIDKNGTKLLQQDLVPRSQGGEKPDHRVRRSRDLIGPILKAKVSGATQRIPGYEVVPSTSDPEDYAATRLSRKILVAGYEGPWQLKKAFRRFVWNALTTEEAFIMPYWDQTVGPFITIPAEEEGQPPQVIGLGEVRACVYSGLEVIWEPGVEFEDSPWFAIEHGRPKDQVEAEPDFLGVSLKADAQDNSIISSRAKPKGGNLVMVTEFFERPCPKYPEGRRLVFANGKEIFPEEPYPLRDHEGNVVDEPCLRRVSYSINGEERHRGLVQSMIESMRQYDYGANKAAEYLQLVLVPQLMGPEGGLKGVITDEPGAYIEIDPDIWAEGQVDWRQMPSMPREFFETQDRAQAELGFVSNANDVPSQVESGVAIQALGQRDAVAWQDFIEDLEEAHAAFGKDVLCLVQQHYTENRLVQFRGRTGWEAIADFKGADIRGQTDVRVRRGSLEPISAAQVRQLIMELAGPTGMFPGHFPPEVVMRAIAQNDIDFLNDAYEEDEARVNFIISQIRAGTFFSLPQRPVFPGEEVPKLNEQTGEPETDGEGKPILEAKVEGWMPRPFDNIAVHKLRIENFMKADEWSHLDATAQKATMAYYRALLDLETRKADRAREVQNKRAEELGMQNAAKPQGPKPLPTQSQPEPSPGSSEAEGEPEAPSEPSLAEPGA